MNQLEKKSQYWINEFSKLQNWEEKYQKIIQIGKSAAVIDEKLKTDDVKIAGCQSQVWLIAEYKISDGMQFKGDSDSVLVKGILSLLLDIYSGSEPEEILVFPADFIVSLGLDKNLSPSRTNGLFSMLKQIKNYALAFSILKNKNSPKK